MCTSRHERIHPSMCAHIVNQANMRARRPARTMRAARISRTRMVQLQLEERQREPSAGAPSPRSSPGHLPVLLHVTLHAAVGRDAMVEDELQDEARPGFTLWKVVVVLGGDLADLGQPGPRDVGEVVMLVVVPNVVRQAIKRAI